MPAPIASLTRELLHDPATVTLARRAAPAVGITQAVYPVAQELKQALLVTLLERGEMQEALVFTRTKHRADRLTMHLVRNKIEAVRIHGNRSQSQRTEALAGFKDGKYRVLVATDIAARGIDVEALGHVVNFDVPLVPDDYIHRVGRTARRTGVHQHRRAVRELEEDGIPLTDVEHGAPHRVPGRGRDDIPGQEGPERERAGERHDQSPGSGRRTEMDGQRKGRKVRDRIDGGVLVGVDRGERQRHFLRQRGELRSDRRF
jgi:superfamily II DNA/RNA helicase